MPTLAPPIGSRPFMIFGVRGGGGGDRMAMTTLTLAVPRAVPACLPVCWPALHRPAPACPPRTRLLLSLARQADVTHPMGGEGMPSIAAVSRQWVGGGCSCESCARLLSARCP